MSTDQLLLTIQEFEIIKEKKPSIIQILSESFARTPQKYIKILEKFHKIKYYDAEQFCNYIASHIEEEEGVAFRKMFTKFDQSLKKKKKKLYPVIDDQGDDDQVFLRKKIQKFVIDFYQQNALFENDRQQRCQKSQNFSYDNNSDQEESESKDKKKNQQSQLQQKQIIQNMEQLHIQQSSSKQLTFIFKQQSYFDNIPQQFRIKKCLPTLLQLNATKQFEEQLSQIKQLIKTQIISGETVIRIYEQFLLDYLKFYYIKQGKCQNYEDKERKQINDKIKLYFQVMNQQNGVLLKNYWNEVHQRLRMLLKEKQNGQLKEQIKNILLKALDNRIYLTFSFAKNLYGYTYASIISININQMNQNLKFESFRYGPLKSFIALTTYHELAHFLIRQTETCEVRSSGSSFTTRSQSVGNQIVNGMRYAYRKIPKQIHLSQKKQNKQQSQHFQQIVSGVKEIFLANKDLFQLVQKCRLNLKQIKETILKLRNVFQKILIKIQPDDLKGIYTYIQMLDQRKEEDLNQNKQISQQQIKYRLFFSLFLSNPFSNNLRKYLREDQKKNYEFYKNKLGEIITAKYFIKNNEAIESIFNKKIMSKFQEEINLQESKRKQPFSLRYNVNVKYFIESFLFKRNKLQELESEILKICEKFDEVKLNSYIIKLQRFRTKIFQDQLFKKLQVKNFLQQNKITNLNQFLKSNDLEDKVNLIFELEVSYKIFKKIFNYSSYLKIATQLPSFFTNISNSHERNFESGYDIEKRLFLKQQIETIYAKDYKLIKQIQTNNNRHLIGVQPQQQSQIKLSVKVNRQGCQRNDVGISLKRGMCGNHYSYLMKRQIQRIKRQRQERRVKTINERQSQVK